MADNQALREEYFPSIKTLFDQEDSFSNENLYDQAIKNILKKILPLHIFDKSPQEHVAFNNLLPYVKAKICEKLPGNISFYVLSRYRPNSFKFFLELISAWLIPGKRLNVITVYAADFAIPNYGQTVYTVCEVIIRVESLEELKTIQSNLPTIETEIRLGMESRYYATRIMEIKGMSVDAKTAAIQEFITLIMNKRPVQFSFDILTEMQHVLVITRDEFKKLRSVHHLAKIIVAQYLFRNELKKLLKSGHKKRYVFLRLFKSQLTDSQESKKVLSFVVGLNFLNATEIFEKQHLLKAVQTYIPHVKAIANSFFVNQRSHEALTLLYVELEKEDHSDFSIDEINLLKKELPQELSTTVTALVHPVFMPRNEEEMMRNILSLGAQLKYIQDIPQVCITFDEQTQDSLFFTMIIVRVASPGCKALEEIFRTRQQGLAEYTHERSKMLGLLRKKYSKESSIFRAKLAKNLFLRKDQSIDLYKARQAIVADLEAALGAFRDFNGGMITKQNEALETLRSLLSGEGRLIDLWLDSYYYSLTPVAMRTILDPYILKYAFLEMMALVDIQNSIDQIKVGGNDSFTCLTVKTSQLAVKETIQYKMGQALPINQMACGQLQVHEFYYFSYLLFQKDASFEPELYQILRSCLPNAEWTSVKTQLVS